MSQPHPSARGYSRRTILRGALGAAAAFPLANVLAACADSAGGGGGGAAKKIAFSHSNSGTPVVEGVQTFAGQRADELGYELLLGNPQDRIDRQVTEVENWITQQIPAMCVFPVDLKSFEPLAKRARDAGLIFTTYAIEMENSDGAVLFSHEDSGRMIGEHAVAWVKDNLSGDAKVLLLGNPAIPDVGARTEVPKQMLLEQTNATIVSEQDAFEPNAGLSVTSAVLQAHPDLNVVIGLNDDGALGAMRAFENAGKDPAKVYIAGQDGAKQALEAIKAGGFYKASAALALKDIGYGVVDLNDELINGKEATNRDIPPVLVSVDDPSAADELIEQWNTL